MDEPKRAHRPARRPRDPAGQPGTGPPGTGPPSTEPPSSEASSREPASHETPGNETAENAAPTHGALAPPPGGWPAWFDPSRDLMLTPRRLRGLVHPVRVRLLWLLETDGPATASQLGRRIGQSSGVTSYHLRTLAGLGFVEEDTARGTGRDRWWRPSYRSSGMTLRSPDDPPDPEGVEVAEQYLRIVAETYYERMLSYINSLAGRFDDLPALPWTFNEHAIELSHDQARALARDVAELIARYRREPGGGPPREGAVRAVFQFQMLPDEVAGGDVTGGDVTNPGDRP